jgi:uncharacterized membrane protein
MESFMPSSKNTPTPKLQRRVEVDVNCSVQQVYDLWGNMENVPRWMPLVKSVKRLRGDGELWHWTFGLGFPLLTEWTSLITRRNLHCRVNNSNLLTLTEMEIWVSASEFGNG